MDFIVCAAGDALRAEVRTWALMLKQTERRTCFPNRTRVSVNLREKEMNTSLPIVLDIGDQKAKSPHSAGPSLLSCI